MNKVLYVSIILLALVSCNNNEYDVFDIGITRVDFQKVEKSIKADRKGHNDEKATVFSDFSVYYEEETYKYEGNVQYGSMKCDSLYVTFHKGFLTQYNVRISAEKANDLIKVLQSKYGEPQKTKFCKNPYWAQGNVLHLIYFLEEDDAVYQVFADDWKYAQMLLDD